MIIRHFCLFFLASGLVIYAHAAEPVAKPDASESDRVAFTPPEVAVGTFTCKAQWNEFCEDQKTIQVPVGHKLCKDNVTLVEKSGNSTYEVIAKDKLGITIKFSAKGNNDRFKQQGASIALKISLQGVHEADECFYKTVKTTTQAPSLKTEPIPAQIPKTEVITDEKIIAPPITTDKKNDASTETAASKLVENKPHACACSQWLQADMVFNCLAKGHGRDNVSCDSMSTTIQCVSSKEDCRDIQKENCEQVLGINQSTSKKRIFVPDSPYCAQQH